MRNPFKNHVNRYLALALILVCSPTINEAAAQSWSSPIPLSSSGLILNTKQCDTRLRLEYTNFLANGQQSTETQFFALDNSREYQYSGKTFQTLHFGARFGIINRLAAGNVKALTTEQFDAIRADFVDAAKSPIDSRFEIQLRSDALPNVVFTYDRLDPLDGSTPVHQLSADSFSLEQKCSTIVGPLTIASIGASSSYSSSFSPSLMIDGLDSTYWISALQQANSTIDVSLASNSTLGQLNLNWYSASYRPVTIDVLTSIDGINFTLTAKDKSPSMPIELAGTKAKFVRVVLKGVTDPFVVVRELKVLGSTL